MISIPVSFLLAALFFVLGLVTLSWRALPVPARSLFFLLFLLMALESSLVGARFAFETHRFLPLQRVLPVWIAPSAYLSFAVLTGPLDKKRRTIVLNGLVALAVTAVIFMLPPPSGYVDVLIAGTFIAYTAALVSIWVRGADVFCEMPTGLMPLLHKLLAVAVAAMTATLVIDALIAVFFARQMENAAAVTVSLVSLLTLIAAVGGTVFSLSGRGGRRSDGADSSEDEAEWHALVERAQEVLTGQGLYRDSGLTLTRLARRVGVPDRHLSNAVNRCLGISVSQFVNQVRLEEAARLLTATGEPVSVIQQQVGFLTRSNFYREFQKHFGEAPGIYRKNAQLAAASTSR